MRLGDHRLKSTSPAESLDFESSDFCTAAACAFAKLHSASWDEIFASKKAVNQIARSIPPPTSKHRSNRIEAVFRVLKSCLLITDKSSRASGLISRGLQSSGRLARMPKPRNWQK